MATNPTPGDNGADAPTVALLLELEEQRCRAITNCDWASLEGLLADDFTYGFLSARIEDRSTYLTGLPTRPHGITRQDLSVRLYDHTAVMTGQFRTFDLDTKEELNAGTGLQVWIQGADDSWKLVALSTTRFGARSTHWSNAAATTSP